MKSGLLLGVVVCTGCLMAPVTQAQTDVAEQLVDEISRSRELLAQREREIATASSRLSQQINRAQQSVVELRRAAAELQRVSDEQTLGLDVLEARLQQWQQQETYQQNLLADFLGRVHGADRRNESFDDTLSALRGAIARIDGRLTPTFEPRVAILESGAAVTGQALSLGPSVWFLHDDGGGLLAPAEPQDEARLVWPFAGQALAELRQLAVTGQASLTLDPTLGRYLELEASRQSLLEHLRAGGVWVLPILGFALLSLVIAAIKITQFARLPKLESAMLVNQATAGNLGRAANLEPLASLFELLRQPATAQQREDRLFDFLVGERARLQHLIGAVAITATVSPLLGLLGTVSGMISTFQSMTVFGSGDPSVVSGGISEALVTTELGLVVAVPSLIIHALLKRKADAYAEQLEATASALADRAQAKG